MSPNPEQFSIPDPKNIPTAGENPTTAGHLEDIPFDKEPLELHYGEDKKQKVDTGQLAQVQTGEYWSPRPPARELPTVETAKKKSNKKLFAWIGGTAAALALAGSAIFVGNAGAEKNTPPTPVETSVSATPNQSQQPEVSATPTQTAEVKPGAVTDNFKFYTGEGENFQTYDELVESIKISTSEHRKESEVLTVFFDDMEKAINYFPNERTVRNNLNKPTGQLTEDDYLNVAAQYRAAYNNVLFSSQSGALYQTLNTIGQQTAYNKLMTLNASEATPYAVKLSHESLQLTVTDNSTLNSIDDNVSQGVGKYRLSTSGLNDFTKTTDEQPIWKVNGNIGIEKVS